MAITIRVSKLITDEELHTVSRLVSKPTFIKAVEGRKTGYTMGSAMMKLGAAMSSNSAVHVDQIEYDTILGLVATLNLNHFIFAKHSPDRYSVKYDISREVKLEDYYNES